MSTVLILKELTQVAEFYANFEPQVNAVQRMLDEAKTVEKSGLSKYLGTMLVCAEAGTRIFFKYLQSQFRNRKEELP